MRVSEPASPHSFSPVLPISPEPVGTKSESTGAESLFLAPEADLPTKAQELENSSVDLLDANPREALSFIPIFLLEEFAQYQCQVSEMHLNSPPKGTNTEGPSFPSVEDRVATASSNISQAFNLTSRTNTQPESPTSKGSEISFNGNRDWAKNAPPSLNLCEASSPIKKGFAPLEEASLDIFAWEYIGQQGTWGNDKLSPFSSAIFPSLSHQKVEESIGFFQTRADGFFSRALGRSQAYEDMMKKILREKDVPEELFYLALIESGFNPHAFSRAKASGIWQFVTKTAKRFGLKVDKWVDERRDPEKSTYAAAAYLKSLYGMFNNWDLATASYNAGEGKVMKAMKRAKSQDFWEISQDRYLRKETKEYVPMFLAAVTIASEPQKYGFSNIDYHPPLLYEKVMVPPSTRLDLIARAAETDLSEIKALNPALKKEKAPPNCSQFEIKLPPGKKEIFRKNFPLLSKKAAPKSKKHSVRPGESLSSIAKKHRVHLQDLCQVNGLSAQARIKPGLILSVPR